MTEFICAVTSCRILLWNDELGEGQTVGSWRRAEMGNNYLQNQ